jgi:hypothetical protein
MKLGWPGLVALTLVFCALPLCAQTGNRFSGVVLETGTGRALPDVAVAIAGEHGAVQAVTDAGGRFLLSLTSAAARLVFVRLGHVTDTVQAFAGMPLRVELRPSAIVIAPLVVATDRPFAAATSRVASELDVRLRPRESSQELLRLAPGLVIAQHAGGGKAEQIFLRGFDADHGTDVALSVDGTPVNVVSHAHGQGYADLHFLIPDVVQRVIVRKGPYAAEDGDFATAGSVTFETADRIERSLGLRYGSFETGHLEAALPFGGDASRAGGYVALAGLATRGPFIAAQDHRRGNLFLKATTPLGAARLAATISGFAAAWDASGQVPQRAIASGLIGRFGAIDDREGGATSRYESSLALSGGNAEQSWSARAFAVRYHFDLFSNFTFFLNDPVNGDGIEQKDERWTSGLQLRGARAGRLLGLPGRTSVGAGTRSDRAGVNLFNQRERARLAARVAARVTQDQLYAWLERELELGTRVRVRLGLRGDAYRVAVHDRLLNTQSGAAWHSQVSPKASLAFDVARGTALFANAGTGFHSNDARAVVLAGDSARVLPRAVGFEVGARRTGSRGSAALALWRLDLQSELVYVGDEGTTEASGRTRRVGIDASVRYALMPWLWADADLNLARGRLRDEPAGADRVPLAPAVTTAGGLTAERASWRAGLRWRGVGARAADETNTVRALGYMLWEVFGMRRVGRAEFSVAVDNLFDTTWNEAQFATTSRLRGERDAVTELHFTPGSPRALQLGVRWPF